MTKIEWKPSYPDFKTYTAKVPGGTLVVVDGSFMSNKALAVTFVPDPPKDIAVMPEKYGAL